MSKLLHRNLEAKLAALNGPEWDSSDDEDQNKDDKKSKTKTNKKKKENSNTKQLLTTTKSKEAQSSQVIYIGHIPPAFEETEILTFFSQFGKITNIKLSRARRTGNPRGYAFVQFDDEEVASIVAETMSGYFLMGERRLVCHVLPKDKIHPKLFNGAKRNLQLCQNELTSSDQIQYWQDKEREVVNKERSMQGIKQITKKLLSREKRKREQLKALGIDYDFPGYAASYDNVHSTTDKESENSKKRKVSVDDAASEQVDDTLKKNAKKIKSKKPATPKSTRKVSIDKNEANTPEKKKILEIKKTPEKKKVVEKKKTPEKKKILEKKKTPEKKVVEKKKTPEKKKVVEKKKTPEKKKIVEKKKTPEKKKVVEKKKTPEKKKVVEKKKTPEETLEKKKTPEEKPQPKKTPEKKKKTPEKKIQPKKKESSIKKKKKRSPKKRGKSVE